MEYIDLLLLTSITKDDIVPTDVTTWEWLFESKEYSPLHNGENKSLAGYVDAITKERLDWAQVKTKSTALSTEFVTKYGLRPGDTVSLFSTNTIWYPVAMFAAIRAGKYKLAVFVEITLMLEQVVESMEHLLRTPQKKWLTP